MKKIYITFLFLFMLSGVIATGFSPSSLVFNLEENQEGCKTITVDSESATISISDKWAENKDVEWKTSLFEESAAYHNIDINYDDMIEEGETSVEVCVSGENIGEYHGVVILREEQEGSSIVQMGVWIKLTVSEHVEEEPNNNEDSNNDNNQITNDGNTGGGGGSSGGSANSNKEDKVIINENEISDAENDSYENKTQSNAVSVGLTVDKINKSNEGSEYTDKKDDGKNTLITGGVIGVALENKPIIILTVIILTGLGLLFIKKKRKK